MPIEPTDAIDNVQRSLSLVPPALLAIVFLAGPTVAWLLYRFVVQPRTRRYAGADSDLLWICDQCRSANEVRSSRCYRCAMERDEIVGALQVVDGDGIVSLGPLDDEDPVAPAGIPVMPAPARSRRPVAVGPGRRPAAAPLAAPARPDLSVALVGDAPRAPVAVGPGTPASGTASTALGAATPVVPARPRKVVAAGRAEAESRRPRSRD